MVFDKLYTYPTITFDNNIINRRIELYLNDIQNTKDEKEKDIITEKIFNLLSNIKYKDKYDYEFLLSYLEIIILKRDWNLYQSKKKQLVIY